MKLLRLFLLIVAGGCFFRFEPAFAQSAELAYAFPKQFSADEVVTTKEGNTMNMKTYMDNGKVRSEMTANGMQVISIIRPDQQKVYSVLTARKMVMVIPLDPAKVKQMLPPGSGGDDKVEKVGPDTVDGVASTKYKLTSSNGKVSFLWVDAAKQFPVKLASEDGAYTVLWKNFQPGPQQAALFEAPSDYQVINMPTAPSAPAGGGQ
jgi:Domain of unknown function (DUF4412)